MPEGRMFSKLAVGFRSGYPPSVPVRAWRSILLDRGPLLLSLRSTALARPQLYPMVLLPDEPVMRWTASPWWKVWQRHHGGLSGSAALVVPYVTLLWLGMWGLLRAEEILEQDQLRASQHMSLRSRAI
jgi:hypothetical protein